MFRLLFHSSKVLGQTTTPNKSSVRLPAGLLPYLQLLVHYFRLLCKKKWCNQKTCSFNMSCSNISCSDSIGFEGPSVQRRLISHLVPLDRSIREKPHVFERLCKKHVGPTDFNPCSMKQSKHIAAPHDTHGTQRTTTIHKIIT